MLITLEPDVIFGSNFVYSCILTLSSHWYEKGVEASPSTMLAGQALLMKMLIHVPLELCGAFGSNFMYTFMYFNIVQLLVCKMVIWLHGATFAISSSFSANAHNSWTAWYIWFKFCILINVF